MSPLPVNLMVVVLFVWKKQKTGVVNLLTVLHTRTPRVLRVIGRYRYTWGGKVKVWFSVLVVVENIHIKDSFPDITD